MSALKDLNQNLFLSLKDQLDPLQTDKTAILAVPHADKSRAITLRAVVLDAQGVIWLQGYLGPIASNSNTAVVPWAMRDYQFEILARASHPQTVQFES